MDNSEWMMKEYKKIEIILNNGAYVETKGLNAYINKEIRLILGNHEEENYVEIIEYIIDYIVNNNPIILAGQNIGYYSWILQFRSSDEAYLDLYEVKADGSGFNEGCDVAISVVKSQSELCMQYNLIPWFPNFNQTVVISNGVYEGKDIEGIRYEPSENISGW